MDLLDTALVLFSEIHLKALLGEMGCGYADGALTAEQTMKLAYHRGTSIMNSKLGIKGGMAAVGLTWETAAARCPEGVYPACHNGQDSVTISGDADKVTSILVPLNDCVPD
jgi:fatty acid synthase